MLGLYYKFNPENGKKLTLDNVTFYGKKADGTPMGASDLGAKDLIELRTSVNAWAKEKGFESINYKGTRVANSSSKNPGMNIDWNIILNK